MMIAIPGVLGADTLAHCRAIAAAADWIDGNETSGTQSALAKRNQQLPEASEAARELRQQVLDALAKTPMFIAAALPLKLFPPLISRYGPGGHFGTHVDNAVRIQRGTDYRIRTDLSATLFLSEPGEYEGGELVVEDLFGSQVVKLAAGDMILYPSSSLHHVNPITRGERLAAVFWIQSMVREDSARRTLFELDTAIQALASDRGNDDRQVISLTGIYHNLLRRWADA